MYWVSFVTYYLLWKAYNHVSDLRAAALMSPEVKAEQFAVLVRDIPAPSNGQTIKEQVDSFFKAIYPDTFYRSMVVTDNKKVFYMFHLTVISILCLGQMSLMFNKFSLNLSYSRLLTEYHM